ncbi:response regulator [Verticiella sediminum]|uniref:Response regulator n=1 Tax=Verticiella sediminum TaxID=1247510 RepID=A0A556AY62_9BURK|nr:response regulator [Verticiella sediminum]TSH97871.1 response regulator [Verticiella sediminum]
MHILLVEDEQELAAWLMRALTESGFNVDHASDCASAHRALAAATYAAILLDLRLPDGDGLSLLGDIRQRGDRTPILILTAQGTLSDRVRGLRLGADDFLVKPFALAELEARLTALVRRSHGGDYPRLRCGVLSYDDQARVFLMEGRPLALTRREHSALSVLLQHSGRPVSRADLFAEVFDSPQDAGPEAIEVIVHRLRKKLDGPLRIVTVRGLGYMLEADSVA